MCYDICVWRLKIKLKITTLLGQLGGGRELPRYGIFPSMWRWESFPFFRLQQQLFTIFSTFTAQCYVVGDFTFKLFLQCFWQRCSCPFHSDAHTLIITLNMSLKPKRVHFLQQYCYLIMNRKPPKCRSSDTWYLPQDTSSEVVNKTAIFSWAVSQVRVCINIYPLIVS